MASGRTLVLGALGLTQILAWGSSFYLLAVLAQPIHEDTGWSLAWVVAGLSVGLLVAGIVSPRTGRLIERHGGRPVLAASACLLAAGLAALAVAPTLPFYLMAWAVIGLGMGTGLYDAAFATLGRLYGQAARPSITTLTLIAGFASTICWPLSAWLVAELGWRQACAVYAAIHLLLALPIHLLTIPSLPAPFAGDGSAGVMAAEEPPMVPRHRLILTLLALAISMGSVISVMMSVHMLTMLEAKGLAHATAVTLAALVGPSQVGARAIEMAIGRHHRPIWTLLASVGLVAGGMIVLGLGTQGVLLGLVLYGGGAGLSSIARGTLPLSLFGHQGYAALMGRLAMPNLLAQALTPSLGALAIGWLTVDGLFTILILLGVTNLAIAIALYRITRPPRLAGRGNDG